MDTFSKQIFKTYDNYKDTNFASKYLSHSQIEISLKKHFEEGIFEAKEIGKSCNGKSINVFKYGSGKIKILLWSQMHGNEATGTQAIFDILNFLSDNKNFMEIKNQIHKECTLYFVPMLNPDGAEFYKRENAFNIDINRDAVKLQTPEGKLLMNLVNQIKPDFGFNLHDQDIYYSAGNTKKPAVISFLTPAFDVEKNINVSRKNSMKLIVEMNKILSNFIPDCIGKYYDDFYPNAFGDNIQKKGVSTILIESGGYYNDPEKQFVRKLNYTAIISGLVSISDKKYLENSISDYEKIPFNKKNSLFYSIFKNKIIEKNNCKSVVDIGMRKRYVFNKKNRGLEELYLIENIGDLSEYSAFNNKSEINIPKKMLTEKFNNLPIII